MAKIAASSAKKNNQKKYMERASLAGGVLSFIFMSLPAQSFMTLSETGEMIKPNEYQVGISPQFLLSDEKGLNATAFADYLYDESTSFRAHLGAGTVDFHTGASVKYVPFPDIDNQPALGVRGGLFLVRDASESNIAFQLAPLASKKVESEYGFYTPYASLSLSYITWREKKRNGTQFVIGSDYQQNKEDPLKFGAELGISLADSYSYILGTISWTFERQRR